MFQLQSIFYSIVVRRHGVNFELANWTVKSFNALAHEVFCLLWLLHLCLFTRLCNLLCCCMLIFYFVVTLFCCLRFASFLSSYMCILWIQATCMFTFCSRNSFVILNRSISVIRDILGSCFFTVAISFFVRSVPHGLFLYIQFFCLSTINYQAIFMEPIVLLLVVSGNWKYLSLSLLAMYPFFSFRFALMCLFLWSLCYLTTSRWKLSIWVSRSSPTRGCCAFFPCAFEMQHDSIQCIYQGCKPIRFGIEESVKIFWLLQSKSWY